MREDTKTIKMYHFEELSDKAQEKAMMDLWDINVFYEWWEFIFADAANVGVRIKGFDLDRGRYCEGEFVEDEWDVAEAILKQHGTCCETYKDAYEFIWQLAIEENNYYALRRAENWDPAYDDFDPGYECPDLLDDFRQTIFEDYRVLLQEEYDYQISEEAIRETINANEYEFTEDGELYG